MVAFEIYRFFADIKLRRWLADKPPNIRYMYVHPSLPSILPNPDTAHPVVRETIEKIRLDLKDKLYGPR